MRLGVQDNVLRHLGIGTCVHISMADSSASLNNRDGCILHDVADQSGSAPRNDGIKQAIQLEHGVRRCPAGILDQLQSFRRNRCSAQGGAQQLNDAAVREQRCAPAAQHDAVAGLEAEGGGVHGHIGAGLIDHADDAQRYGHLDNMQTVRAIYRLQRPSHWIRESYNLAHSLCDARNPIARERETIQQGGGGSILASALQVQLIGCQYFAPFRWISAEAIASSASFFCSVVRLPRRRAASFALAAFSAASVRVLSAVAAASCRE